MAVQALTDAQCRIEMLGWLCVQQADRTITRFQTQKTGVLLALLAFHPHRSRPREELVEMLWPGEELDSARHKLRMALSSLRKQLEPPGVPAGAVLLADRASVQLNPGIVTTDVADYDAALNAAPRSTSAIEQLQHLTTAVELYKGPLLPGYYEDWIEQERQRLSDAQIHVLEQMSTHLEQIGDFARAIGHARRAVEADPLREEAHFLLIRLLKAAGQPRAALRHYVELERILEEELDAAPSAAIRDMVRHMIRSGEISRDEPTDEVERGIVASLSEGPADAAPAAASPSPEGAATVIAFSDPLPRRPDGAPDSRSTPLLTGTVTLLLAEMQRTPAPSGAGHGSSSDIDTEAIDEILCPLFRSHGGHPLPAPAESWWIAFGRASDALAATMASRSALSQSRLSMDPRSPAACGGPLSVRIALHTGEVGPGEAILQTPAFPLAMRLLLAAHPGQILLSEKTAVLLRGQLDPGLRLVDLGAYRLHEQSEPEHLFHVTDAQSDGQELPPPNALPGTVSNLPPQFTRFFGRESEIAQIQQLLANGSRLVTLTGPCGQGKTRLALELAKRHASQLHAAVWFVGLADVTDPRQIPEAILEAMRLPRSPQLDPMEQAVDILASQKTLLILDNFEQLLPDGAGVLRTLQERVTAMAVLVTSRQCLGLLGEREYPLSALRMPRRATSPEQLLRYETVQLFVDRAQAVRSDFQVTPANMAAVAQLCARLEGLPLAIELAAARIGVLTPAQMVERLKQRFDLLVSRKKDAVSRHRTLRAAIDWSYQLLSPELQRFFARLSVFKGGWTLAAAEAICEERLPEDETLSPSISMDYLAQLRDCSLVLTDGTGQETRFSMLETLRQYAAEQLDATARAELAGRHARYYLELAEQAEPHLHGPEQGPWMDRLEREHTNLRTALRGLESAGDGEAGLRLAGALWRFWYVRGYWKFGRARLAALLALPGPCGTMARAKALHGAGVLAHYQGDYSSARTHLEESLWIRRSLEDEPGIAHTLTSLGFLARSQGEDRLAFLLFQTSQRIWERIGHKGGMAMSLEGLGNVALAQGDLETARSLYEESLALLREAGDKRLLATSLCSLGDLARLRGDVQAARALYEESLTYKREVRSLGGTALSLTGLGNVALGQGDSDAARSLFLDSLRIRRQLGDRGGIAECLEGLASVAARQARWAEAGQLFGLAEALRDGMKGDERSSGAPAGEGKATAASSGSTVDQFLAAWASGRGMALEQALADLLAERDDQD